MVLTSTSFPVPDDDAMSMPPAFATALLPAIVQLRTVQSPARSLTYTPPPEAPLFAVTLPTTRHVSIVTAPVVALTAKPAPDPPWNPLADTLFAIMEWSIAPCPPENETP